MTLRLWPDIERRIRRSGIEYSPVFTEGIGHGRELARAAIKEGFKKIFAVGGDGTLNEVINGIELNLSTVGVIPTGLGNDLAKMIGIRSVNDGIVSLLRQNLRRIDLGKMKSRYFVNNLGIGFNTEVARYIKKVKIFRGNWGYLFSVLNILFNFKAYQVEVISERNGFFGNIMSVSVGNGQFHGGCFQLTPQAVIDDGLLDVCIIQSVGRMKFLLNIPRAIKGTHACLKEVKMFKAKKIILRSDKDLFMHLDGEVISEPLKEIKIEVIPGSLEIFVPYA